MKQGSPESVASAPAGLLARRDDDRLEEPPVEAPLDGVVAAHGPVGRGHAVPPLVLQAVPPVARGRRRGGSPRRRSSGGPRRAASGRRSGRPGESRASTRTSRPAREVSTFGIRELRRRRRGRRAAREPRRPGPRRGSGPRRERTRALCAESSAPGEGDGLVRPARSGGGARRRRPGGSPWRAPCGARGRRGARRRARRRAPDEGEVADEVEDLVPHELVGEAEVAVQDVAVADDDAVAPRWRPARAPSTGGSRTRRGSRTSGPGRGARRRSRASGRGRSTAGRRPGAGSRWSRRRGAPSPGGSRSTSRRGRSRRASSGPRRGARPSRGRRGRPTRISATHGAELPSRIGTSGPSTSTVRLSRPSPTAAERRCSTVPTSRPRSPSDVAKSSRPASSATAGRTAPTSVRMKTIPRPAGAGRRVARISRPEWRPTPETEIVRPRVVCNLITPPSTHAGCQPDALEITVFQGTCSSPRRAGR